MTASLSGLAVLAGVRAFLAEQIAPEVPGELAGELRAAIKLLDTVGVELNQRHRVLRDELADLLDYAQRIAGLLALDAESQAGRTLARRAEDARLDLAALDLLWRDARALSAGLLVELCRYRDAPTTPDAMRQPAGALAAEFCTCLGGHARARLAWQAVFPVPVLTSSLEEPIDD
ncbi:MAG TPA: hypothetical protein VGH89_38405 [Pseudonocardia sp.]|jgi:hypothetical protein